MVAVKKIRAGIQRRMALEKTETKVNEDNLNTLDTLQTMETPKPYEDVLLPRLATESDDFQESKW